jgi:hypothetical protein
VAESWEEDWRSVVVACVVPKAASGLVSVRDARPGPASLLLPPAGVSETLNVSMIWSAICCPSGVSLAGVVTQSCLNIEAMSAEDEEAVTGLGLKTGALG